MREHSKLELLRKLSRYADEHDDVENLLNWLEASQFLSSERFSDSLVNRRCARFGNNRILAELQGHQVGDVELDRVKKQLITSESDRATTILHRKFPTSPVDYSDRMKQCRFLQQRGFSSRAIQDALRTERFDDLD